MIAVDLFCGLGGWTDGLLAAGWDVYGFDITRHEYALPEELPESDGSTKNPGYDAVSYRGKAWNDENEHRLGLSGPNKRPLTRLARYPAQLILQDALTIHGSQFRNADLIVASPPCQAYSYLAMPWSRSKCPLCKGKKFYFEWQLIRGVAPGHMTEWGRPVPCDCKENSQKAKELRRKWETEGPDNRLFDACFRIQREAIEAAGRYIPLIVENVRGAVPWVGPAKAKFGSFYLWGDVAQVGDRVYAGSDLKSMRFGGGVARLDGDARKLPPEVSDSIRNGKSPARWTNPAEHYYGPIPEDGTKIGGDWFSDPNSTCRKHGSRSNARKAASAMIAKIPLPLSRYIGEVHKNI